MRCQKCQSENRRVLNSEMCIHLSKFATPAVFVFPKIALCLNCGFAEFSLTETELQLIAERDSSPPSLKTGT
jgi:predicted nucleic-acid-binding Zn-ribbon protein